MTDDSFLKTKELKGYYYIYINIYIIIILCLLSNSENCHLSSVTDLNVTMLQSYKVTKRGIREREVKIWSIQNNVVTLPKNQKQAENNKAMRAVVQRVSHASVTIEGITKSRIEWGFLVLLGICEEDTEEDVDWLVKKIACLRVFDDEDGVMNRSLIDIGGEALVVSQFTLYASYKKGNRPSWFRAGSHEHSIPLYEAFCSRLSEAIGRPVGTGEFGADMKVELLNDGPVTICMDTKNKE